MLALKELDYHDGEPSFFLFKISFFSEMFYNDGVWGPLHACLEGT